MIEITLTTVAAWGSFALGERLHGSGAIAAVCAGMVCGTFAAKLGMSYTTRAVARAFWDYLVFAFNSWPRWSRIGGLLLLRTWL